MSDNKFVLKKEKMYRDIRTLDEKISDFLFIPKNYKYFIICSFIFSLILPFFWFILPFIFILLNLSFISYKYYAPLRVPKDQDMIDYSDFYNVEDKKGKNKKIYKNGSGILYLGKSNKNKEIWLTNSDCRTHMFIAGTTGSGKSELLKSLCYNAICWGQSVVYSDGKADSSLPFSLWGICRKFGREDDFLVINFLTGGIDVFSKIAKKEIERSKNIYNLHQEQSNTMNPFAEGSSDFLRQLVSSLLPQASGESAQWRDKAMNMFSSVLTILCYERAKYDNNISVNKIKDSIALHNLLEFYKKGKKGEYPELAFQPLKTYFETALPGFTPSLINKPIEDWDSEIFNQHGYLTSQFVNLFSMLTDVYGHIFGVEYPDVDMSDVLISNRILVVLIPSLEKSGDEAAALGKMIIALTKLMMAQNLGYKIEGKKEETLDIKATNSPFPSLIITDELGYYYAQGLAVQYAQARSLGFSMIAGVQDIQALKRGEGKDESASLIANTKVKISLALEDPSDTFEMIKKSAGKESISAVDRVSTNANIKKKEEALIKEVEKITLEELQSLSPGEGYVIALGKVIRFNSFYIPENEQQSSKLSLKINRFIEIEQPTVIKFDALNINKELNKPINIDISNINNFAVKNVDFYYKLSKEIKNIDTLKFIGYDRSLGIFNSFEKIFNEFNEINDNILSQVEIDIPETSKEKYISLYMALNIPLENKDTGDFSKLDLNFKNHDEYLVGNDTFFDTCDVLGDLGIIDVSNILKNMGYVPSYYKKPIYSANHARACVDLLLYYIENCNNAENININDWFILSEDKKEVYDLIDHIINNVSEIKQEQLLKWKIQNY